MRTLTVTYLMVALVTPLLGCEGDGSEMVVDLRTDMVPGQEFTGVRATLRLDSSTVGSDDTVATLSDDYIEGLRVLSVGDLDPGTYRVDVDLISQTGERVAGRTVVVRVDGTTGVTVLVARDTALCEPSSCATTETCAGLMCVDQMCTPETPDTCPDAECASNGDCATRADCAIPICVSGTCFYAGQAGSCSTEEWCNPDVGCVPQIGMPMDGGAPDGGTLDGATGCPMGMADCDGDMSNGCELPVATDIQNCGNCGVRCGDVPQGSAACVMGACAADCDAGFSDCNADLTDGCEVDTRDDPANCRVCGSACPTANPICIDSDCVANPFPSDGSEGAFEPTTDTVLSAGVHKFTTITIPAGVTVRADTSGVLELYATGDVLVEGIIDLDGGDGADAVRDVGAGGGGETGTSVPGVMGTGPACLPAAGGGTAGIGADGAGSSCGGTGGRSGGGGGGANSAIGAGGGGGGGGRAGGGGGSRASFAGGAGGSDPGRSMGGTAGTSQAGGGGEPGLPPYSGLDATCAVLSLCGGGGGSIGAFAAADLAVASSFWPGSGGGGGSGITDGSGAFPGSGGGGGGGALRVSSNTSIHFTLSSSILATGGDGGAVHSGGGGGSGGTVYLAAPTLRIEGVVDTSGGIGASTTFADGGNGGIGRIRLSVLPGQCTLTGTFMPPPMSGCAPADMAGATYIADFPD